MKCYTLFLYGLLAAMLTACGNKNAEEPQRQLGTSTSIEGDSTLYGLACDGCTDSVLVFLPGKGGDPVNYDIIEANKQRQVIGRPQVGDWVCVLVNPQDPKKADRVINLDLLKGRWVNLEKPYMKKKPAGVVPPEPMKPEEKAEMDSITKEKLKPVEIGFALKRQYRAQPIGMEYSRHANEDSPIVYPTPKVYSEWHIFNGRLVLTEGSFDRSNKQKAENKFQNDTVDILLLSKDTLRIRFKDGEEKGFSRK